ncbi:MAG TPA: hydantoinase/oxoprolinase family protein [Solirubrobacteraceae bacterium]|jgi:N-methylhydantoinase A
MTTLIGVDVGGTHTDVAVLCEDRLVRGKAPTRYENFAIGLLDAIAVAAEALDLSADDLLRRTDMIVNSTTVVTNAITELRGARVGVLVTAGFRDTFRLGGGPRRNIYDDHLQTNMPDLVARQDIVEIHERIDYAGKVLVEIDDDEVAHAAGQLITESGVTAIAICFLSSYQNPENEQRAARVIERDWPDVFTSASHELVASRGESRRWTTAVLNAFVHESATQYVQSVAEELRAAGFAGRLAFFQGVGGAIGQERALRYPLALLGSGPAGGALGACELARTRGEQRLLLGDMGGTSFDTGIVFDGELPIAKKVDIGPFKTGADLVDIVSVGAGGGSIAWISERGTPQVGPRSARAKPGPAAYGQGGIEPTVTDAMVVMGFIDPDSYLGGRQRLDAQAARQAVDERFAAPLGWSTEEGAAAIHDLAVVNMALAVREVTVERGHDPREFVFVAFGGTLPMFAAEIATELGIGTVVIPRNSSVFCAQGLLLADFVVRRDQTVDWLVADEGDLDRVRESAETLVERTAEELRADGFEVSEMTVSRSGSLRFDGQTYELPLPMPDRPLMAGDGDLLTQGFRDAYERLYGAGTAWSGAPVCLRDYTVTATAGALHGTWVSDSVTTSEGGEPGRRQVYLPDRRAWEELPIYRDGSISAGDTLEGPCVIDATDTTIYVPDGASAHRESTMAYRLTLEARR